MIYLVLLFLLVIAKPTKVNLFDGIMIESTF